MRSTVSEEGTSGLGNLSLERGLAVLRAFGQSKEPVGVREIARRTGQSPATAQRIINSLANQGFVERSQVTRRYRLGHSVLALGRHILQSDQIVVAAEPELRLLAAHGCFNAFLGERRGPEGLYLLAVQSRSPVTIHSSPGESFKLYSTALGKALLMGLERNSILELLEKVELERLTPRTIVEPAKLAAQIEAASRAGYTTSLDESFTGIVSVGAPILGANGAVIAAISVAYPRSVGPQIEIVHVAEMVMAAASRASRKLGLCT